MKSVSLSELGRIVTGKTPKTSNPEFFDGATPFVTPSDMTGERTIYRTGRSLSDAGIRSVKNCVVPKGAIMVSCIGSDMGKAHIAATQSVTNQQINTIIVDEGAFSPLFVYYNLYGRRAELREKAGGAAQPILNKTDFGKVEIECPPLSEQREIAAILGALDDKIEVNRKASATLEEMARALYHSWFVDFDPVWARLEGRQPAHMDATTAALFPDSFGDDGLPVGWSERGLDEVADFLNGAALQKYPVADGEDYLTVIKIAELRNGISSGSGKASAALPEKFKIVDGDVIFSWSGSLLQRVWTGGAGALNQHLFKVTSAVVPKWFHFFAVDQHMNDFRMIAASKATTMGHIQRHHLAEAKVILPDSSVLEVADRLIAPMFNWMIQMDLESRTLAILRDTLLPRLMCGELRVGEARELVEEVA